MRWLEVQRFQSLFSWILTYAWESLREHLQQFQSLFSWILTEKWRTWRNCWTSSFQSLFSWILTKLHAFLNAPPCIFQSLFSWILTEKGDWQPKTYEEFQSLFSWILTILPHSHLPIHAFISILVFLDFNIFLLCLGICDRENISILVFLDFNQSFSPPAPVNCSNFNPCFLGF